MKNSKQLKLVIGTGTGLLVLLVALYVSFYNKQNVEGDRKAQVLKVLEASAGPGTVKSLEKEIKYLELPDLLRWNDFRIKLADLSVDYCAAISRGGMSEEIMLTALSKLDNNELKELFDLMGKGSKLKLVLKGAPDASPSHVIQAIRVVTVNLSKDEQAKFQNIMLTAKDASIEDNCWASMKLLNGIKNMEDDTMKSMALKGFLNY